MFLGYIANTAILQFSGSAGIRQDFAVVFFKHTRFKAYCSILRDKTIASVKKKI